MITDTAFLIYRKSHYYGPRTYRRAVAGPFDFIDQAQHECRTLEADHAIPMLRHNQSSPDCFRVATILADFIDSERATEFAVDLLGDEARAELPPFASDDFGAALEGALADTGHMIEELDGILYVVELAPVDG